MSQLLQLEAEPLSKWITAVIKKGRQMDYPDNEIKSWIRSWARSRNYSGEYINKLLRSHGIRVYNRRPIIYKNYPKLVICPTCVTIGKINVYYPNGKTVYVIRHELIDGTWGKVSKKRRCRRCYILDKEGLRYIRQKLDFYEKRDMSDLQQNERRS